jgi:transposase
MSPRVYVSRDIAVTTAQEDTPVSIRIQLSSATVKALHARLPQAYRKDDGRLVRRTTVLIDLLVHHVAMAVLCERWGLSASCLYDWQRAFLLHGPASVRDRHRGGRRPQLTPKQQQRVGELLEAGPLVVGGETACWDAVLIRVLLWRAFGVLSNRPYGWTFLRNGGFSFHKARFGSDHLDAAKRRAWLEQKWPTLVRAATRRPGLSLVEDEASLAQWGSFSYTWARRGQQPEVPTSGKRQGSKVFGAIDSFSGRLCSPGIEGRFQADSSQAFVQMILAQTTQPLFLLHDGARYHTSASTQAFLAAPSARIPEPPLPS